MSDKTNADGTPNVLFLEDAINDKWGASAARVICPITDPFVRHHGALGSFVRVYLKNKSDVNDVTQYCRSFPQVEEALESKEAAKKLELAVDREGDIVVVASQHAVIGSGKEEHDLSNLGEHRLRSHGGVSEQNIPLLMSRPARKSTEAKTGGWRNFDAFDLVLNF